MEMFENLEKSKQERIINAALSEFAHRGYRDASTNVITQQAGISKGALFHYFENKETLYSYLMDYTADRITEMVMADMPETDDLIELFYYFAIRKTKLAIKYPLMFDFLYRVIREEPDHPKYHQLIEQSSAIMRTITEGQIDTSRFRPGISFERAIEICMWTSEGFGQAYARQHQSLQPEDMVQGARDLLETLKIMLYKEDE